MFSLLLAILSSYLVSVMMRVGESRSGSKMGLLLTNYVVTTLIALFYTLRGGMPGEGVGFAAGLGIFGGFLFLYSLVVFQQSIARNGVVLSSTFMKLGVLVPTVMAMVVFREQPQAVKLVGMVLAVAAIVVLNFERGQGAKASGKGMLILLLLVCGGTDAVTNTYDKLGNPAGKDLFLLIIFATAMVFSAVLLIRRGERPNRWDILCGIGVGIPNYFSSRFILAALKTVPATVTFPVFSASTILLITLTGVLVFHETLDKKKIAALALIVAALVLLNI